MCVSCMNGDRIEHTVPFETNIDKAHSRKQSKYADLVDDFNQKGYNCQLYCVEVGSRRFITNENEKRLSSIFQDSEEGAQQSGTSFQLYNLECAPSRCLGKYSTYFLLSPSLDLLTSLLVYSLCLLFV